ncbi:MAG: discoidin domain-containing protein [Bacteroidaceae bacterium]|nr:discoidin domain-containing protein [Bacteroidaceae bacterium]
MRTIFTSLLLVGALTVSAQQLQGFEYGTATAPDGTEWQSPERLSLNKLQPRSNVFHFATRAEALAVLPTRSPYYQSLDGTWKFRWVASPQERDSTFHRRGFDASAWDDIQVPGCWNVQGLQKDGIMKYGVPIYVNQPVIFYHEVRTDDWRKGVMRTPPTEWTTFKYRNEVGSYLRTFTVPANWKGRRVLINFDGVDSFFYLWINGHYVGFSKNSRNTASFNITPYLNQTGENTVAVEVYRSSDGSFLESQDMFRLPGIYRSAYLTSEPLVHLSDLVVHTTDIDQPDAKIQVDVKLHFKEAKFPKHASLHYYVYPVELYTDRTDSKPVVEGQLYGSKATTLIYKALRTELEIPKPKLWSAERPYRYVLVTELHDKNNKVLDCVSTYFGVRKVEIRDTKAEDDEFGLAGRYFYVNNKPVKLKGVNRHETSPWDGHAITHKQMTEEVFLMKRGNINHVRLSHYSNDPYFYYLADKYGLYLEDECNIESHQYYYGDASLSHPKEWRAAHIARNMEMVHGHINHPSIVIWSLGNEAGPGDNFKAAYEAIRAYDRSRPVQYERNNDIVDMGSNQYPSVEWVQWVAKGKANVKYPYHISEYAHSMGNSLGNLVDYWTAMESTNYFCGAAIWDWVDQAIVTYTKDGREYMGYGGDHGDWPNDGMFCMNGILLPDLTPKPQYFEVKKVYQNLGVTLDTVRVRNERSKLATFDLFNKQYFADLADYNFRVVVFIDGRPVATQDIPYEVTQPIGPRSHGKITVPITLADGQHWGECFLTVEAVLRNDQPWAQRGFVQMAEQLPICNETQRTALASIGKIYEVTTDEQSVDIRLEDGDGQLKYLVSFDNATGAITHLQYPGQADLFGPGTVGPQLDAFRAPVDNDNWAWNQWFRQGLYKLEHKTLGAPIVQQKADGSVTVVYTVRSQAATTGDGIKRPGKAGQPFQATKDGTTAPSLAFTTTQRYTIHTDGSISVAASIVSSESGIALPRLGYALKLRKYLNNYEYYGRGPLNNYADRKTGSFVARYKSTVEEQFVNFPKPQSMGNREEVRWCALTDNKGYGVQFIADRQPISASVLPWSALQMTLAAHPHELPESDGTYVHLDCQVTGLGGNSCGQGGPLDPDCVKGALHQMHFIIRPVKPEIPLDYNARVSDASLCPVSIARDRAGAITITGDNSTDAAICYQLTSLGAKKPGPVHKCLASALSPVSFREGGTVAAWYADEPAVRTTATYERLESVPVEIAYVSSEEGPGGEVASNLLDGDPTTIWHTMYSITVPKFPHWVDFDCNETKLIKGFTYLPRQDGSANGNIHQYKVELSTDGKQWQPAAEGSFSAGPAEKRVLFEKPARARYLRFTALSAQNGADFASGAEFTVIAE